MSTVSQRVEDIAYVRHLALQTGTDISNWNVPEIVDAVSPGDRRAINRIFFSKQEESQKLAAVELPDAERIETQAKAALDQIRENKIAGLQSNLNSCSNSAREKLRQYHQYVRQAWNCQREIMALENRSPTAITDEIRKIIAGGFWKYHGYADRKVRFVTLNDVHMSEVNPSQGINRHVDLGKYMAYINVESMHITLARFERNYLSNRKFHPYVDYDGDICWGNSSNTVSQLLTTGKFSDAMGLLAALLTTYSQDSTPWEELRRFHELQERGASRVHGSDPDPTLLCPNCENEIGDDCECVTCEWCEHRGDAPCEQHYCGICDGPTRYPQECCCPACEHSVDNCVCCGICGGNREMCDCCQECERSDSRCDRCRECDRHDNEHSETCSNREVTSDGEA